VVHGVQLAADLAVGVGHDAPRVGVGAHQVSDLDDKAGLLLDLADRRIRPVAVAASQMAAKTIRYLTACGRVWP
jgi:hypothetical protein